MRILLDECVNPRVKEAFPNHEAKTVKEMGWGGITNGKLMALGQQSFDVFITVDQNLEHQQNLAKLSIGIVVVAVPDNNIKYFRPIFPEMLTAAESVRAGEVIHITSPFARRQR
jgi:predicted nuclease of predicted toxin-antitoxin system